MLNAICKLLRSALAQCCQHTSMVVAGMSPCAALRVSWNSVPPPCTRLEAFSTCFEAVKTLGCEQGRCLACDAKMCTSAWEWAGDS